MADRLSEFVIGTDDFSDLTINEVAEGNGFHYFSHQRKSLIKRFVLKRTKLSEKLCVVTLIKSSNGKFEPRFEFQIRNLTKKTIEQIEIPVVDGEVRLVKARVDLNDCHKEFSQLMKFIQGCTDIQLDGKELAVVTKDQKELIRNVIDSSGKEAVLEAVSEKYGNQLSEKDIILITKRKKALERFDKLLNDPEYFSKYQQWLKERGKSNRPEDVWQHFFENNSWIFGYGLQLVACENLDNKKLETIVVGSDILDGAGKEIDGLLKTRGNISRSLFTEIKLHSAPLLEKYDRSAVWVPAKDLRGSVAQVQKTIHKVDLKITRNLNQIRDKEGNPSGEEISFIKAKGIVVIGTLKQFGTEHGVNDEMLASFELYRQQINGLEIITFDELYERTKFIVEDS